MLNLQCALQFAKRSRANAAVKPIDAVDATRKTWSMALPSALYDFQLHLSNVDAKIDEQLSFKVARHPSEIYERVWLRVLAYCWQYEERLTFGKGLSDPDSPDLETRDYTQLVTKWIRVGKPEAQKIQRAVDQNQSAKVVVLFEDVSRMESFFHEATDAKLTRLHKAHFAAVESAFLKQLASDENRRNTVSVTLVGDHFYIDCNGESVDGPLIKKEFPK
jgi:uncharacterized protein YaeQ